MTGGRSPPQLCFSLSWQDSLSTAAALIFSLELGVIRHRPPFPVVKFFGQRCSNVEAVSWRRAGDRHIWPEPALVARTCSPARLLGFLKFVGTPRCNDARRRRS